MQHCSKLPGLLPGILDLNVMAAGGVVIGS